jgi:outer membrane protein assembly factor BamB
MRLSSIAGFLRAAATLLLLSTAWSWADNQRFPIEDASSLSPPIVELNIHECALAVTVSSLMPSADAVDVFANGMHVGRKDKPKHGSVDVPLDRALVLGESITATQTVGSITSKPSLDPVSVTGYPALTRPVIIPKIYQCGRAAPVGNLVASTHVDVWDTAMPPPPFLGSGEATRDWLAVGTSSLIKDHLIRAKQTACPGIPAKTVTSAPSEPPLKVSEAPNPPPSPWITPPHPATGSPQLLVHGLLAGAQIQINYGNTPIFDGYASAADNLVDVPPVPGGGVPVTAIQSLCTSSPPSPVVTATDDLPAPILADGICEGSNYVYIDQTQPGTTVVVVRSGKVIGGRGGDIGMVKVSIGGSKLVDGDVLTAVQYVESPLGNIYSPPSNQVTVGCDETVNVVTQHNNNQRTGVYSAERTLTPDAVLARGMRVKYAHPIDGWVNAQPLYVRGVEFPQGGANGLFVATFFSNKVYALNADTGAEQWVTTLVDSDPSKRGLAQGIDSTPVIDVPNHLIYVAFSTKNQAADIADQPDSTHPPADGKKHLYQDTDLKNLDTDFWIVALDYRTGHEVARTMVNSSMYRANGETVRFEAPFHRQHPALLLDHGVLYVAFGSIAGSEGFLEYHGWVMAYRAYDLSLQATFNTSKNYKPSRAPYGFNDPDDASGLWQGGGGLTADRDGNIYFLSGNGTADLANDKFGDSFIKLVPTGSSLIPSVFVPSNADAMEKNDADFGAGGALSIPGTDFVVGGGKPGYMYLLDRKSMLLRQKITASTNQYDPSRRDDTWNQGPHLHGSPSYWRGPDPAHGSLYVWGEKDFLRLYRFNTVTGRLEEPAQRRGTIKALQTPMPGGMISISSDRNRPGTGIVWATLPASAIPIPFRGRLYAFEAETLKPLWDTGYASLGHWAVPTIADGKVFVGTSSGILICYELGPDQGARTGSWTPFQPHELVAEHPMVGHWDESVMTALPRNTELALTPPSPATNYAEFTGEGDAVFVAEASAQRGDFSWAIQGNSLQGNLTLVGNAAPAGSKVEVKVTAELVWTASDGSRAETRILESYTAPESSDTKWELHEVTRASGQGVLTNTRFIQRLFTRGGLPPSATPVSRLDTARVPFEAQYVLYR